jgi:molybdopterin-guanine dinucleotide biosynthesis adapter protein
MRATQNRDSMNVVGFAGYSGSGKTTLVEQLIPALRLRGQRVSIIKHAHHSFDIDHPGKDTHRHREAGAFEVLVASNRRLALIREYEREAQPNVHHLLAEVSPAADWVLVEGFKSADLLKIEVWRSSAGNQARYPDDPYVVAIATDSPNALPEPTGLPLLDLNSPDAVADFLLGQGTRFEYQAELYNAGLSNDDLNAALALANKGMPA